MKLPFIATALLVLLAIAGLDMQETHAEDPIGAGSAPDYASIPWRSRRR